MKKTLLCLCLSLLAFFSPLLSLLGLAFLTPSVYDESFVGILDEKVDRLQSTEKSKIIIIGGSSVAFGIDSELLAEQTQKEVVNFGLYAALGTKVMMDLSKRGIERGDTVILMPEADVQTLSLYFGADMAWRAIEDQPSLFFSLPIDNQLSMLGSLYRFVKEKCSYLKKGDKSRSHDIYAAESFNEYGDIAVERYENTMAHRVDPNGTITLSSDILSSDFVDYVNDYIRYCEKKGASVYFAWCPMNELAVADLSADLLSSFESMMKEKISCRFLGSINDAVMDAAYFYDTNFHLNSIGAENHTLLLARDYWAAKGVDLSIDSLLLDPPELAIANYEIEMEDPDSLSDFILEETYWHNAATGEDEFSGYRIVGLTESGRNKAELTIPVCKNGLRVCYLANNALSGGAVETLVLPAELSMGLDNSFVLEDGFSAGASHLQNVYCYVQQGNEVRPPSAWQKDITLFIPSDAENYESYNWSKLSVKIETIKTEKP